MNVLHPMPAVVSLIALILLWLNAWEAEAGRRIHHVSAQAGRWIRQHPLYSGRHDALEVRLAGWCYFAALIWLRGSWGRDFSPGLNRWLLPLGVIPGMLLVLGGWWLGRAHPFPSRAGWPIAPYHGWADWILWIWGGLRRILLARVADRGESEDRAESTVTTAHQGVQDLASLSLEEIMIPRSQVVGLDGSLSVREVLPEVRRAPHALYPVYGESVDQPLGVVRILDLAGVIRADQPVRDLVRPITIVPETAKGLSLLGDLCGAPVPAALVVDEFGGMAGLVTVEDLVEVLVGDLVGEHDVVRVRILPLGRSQYRVEGTTRVEEFNERFGSILPEGEYETVAGLYLDRVGRIPQAGETLALPAATLEVLERTERRILWLQVTLHAGSESAPSSVRPTRPRPALPE